MTIKLKAKKSLGQHFLTSKSALDQIIKAAKIQKDANILEIGPGTGILTQELLKSGAKVTAVEKDQRATEILNQNFADSIKNGSLSIISNDILELNTKESIKEPYSIVANIPYYITGAILEKFLENEPRPTNMVLLVQKEVAERVVAKEGKESILSISVKAFGSPKIIAKVPRGAFNPPPTVDSAILSVENISSGAFLQNNLAIDPFFKTVKAGFSHKRKYVSSNLANVYDKNMVATALAESGIDEKARAEDIPTEKWLKLAKILN